MLLSQLRHQRKTLKFSDFSETWDYPAPIITDQDSYSNRRPDDGYLQHLIYMAEYGWYYCQKVIVDLAALHPLTSYLPVVDDEFRKTFMKQLDDDPMPLTIYQRDGKLVLGTSWEEYALYRELEKTSAVCIIIGHFTEGKDVSVIEKPFMINRKLEALALRPKKRSAF